MTWEKTQPIAGSDLASAPVRGNFAAIDEALLGASAKPQPTPNLTVLVGAFRYLGADGTLKTYAGGTSPSATAPAANPRIGVLTIDDAASLAWTYGAEAATPIPPNYPIGKVPLIEMYGRVGMTQIKAGDDNVQGYILRVATKVVPVLPPGLAGPWVAGSVVFAGPTGLMQDNANLFWDDTLNNLLLFGGAVGTSGQKVLALGAGVAPTTSPADTVQAWVNDWAGEAGSATLQFKDERGDMFTLIGHSTGIGYHLAKVGGSTAAFFANPTSGAIGTYSSHPLDIVTAGAARISIDTSGHVGLGVAPNAGTRVMAQAEAATVVAFTAKGGGSGTSNVVFMVSNSTDQQIFRITDSSIEGGVQIITGSGLRGIATGAVDSGGAGYRLLRVGN